MTSKNNIFIAFQGSKFTIEWYINDNEKSAAADYFSKLSFARQKKLMHLLNLLGNRGKIESIEKFRHEENQIYVFKPQPDRFFCFFFTGAKVVITNAYEKKSDKMPKNEFAKAEIARNDYVKRCKEGIYYDKKSNK